MSAEPHDRREDEPIPVTIEHLWWCPICEQTFTSPDWHALDEFESHGLMPAVLETYANGDTCMHAGGPDVR